MADIHSRRELLGLASCAGGCLLLGAISARAQAEDPEAKKSHDFDTLTYCCFECRPERCPLLRASLANDLEAKKQMAMKWREKYGREFSPEEVFCFGCKVAPEKQGFGVRSCTVRACVVGKGLVSCAHCRELRECQRELWVNYPDFRQAVLRIQKDVLD